MTIENIADGTLVYLSKSLDTRGKWLQVFYFWMFFLGFIAAVAGLLLTYETILFLAFAVVSGIAAYRFGNSASLSERIFINKKELRLITKSWFKNRTVVYDISKVSKFRHLAKPELSKHPLAGESFDYLGFQTEQKVISEMHGDNRLGFEYEGKLVTFGENVYSWEFNELEVLLFDITGNDLRYDDEFEKNFKPQ
jgi:hypothetical protein